MGASLLLILEYVPVFTLIPRFIMSIGELYARDVQGRRGGGFDTGIGLLLSGRGVVGTNDRGRRCKAGRGVRENRGDTDGGWDDSARVGGRARAAMVFTPQAHRIHFGMICTEFKPNLILSIPLSALFAVPPKGEPNFEKKIVVRASSASILSLTLRASKMLPSRMCPSV